VYRSRSAFPTTEAELRLKASAANMSDSSHPVRGYSRPAGHTLAPILPQDGIVRGMLATVVHAGGEAPDPVGIEDLGWNHAVGPRTPSGQGAGLADDQCVAFA
jgi:hypothetical protein